MNTKYLHVSFQQWNQHQTLHLFWMTINRMILEEVVWLEGSSEVQYTTIIVFFRVYSFTNIVTNKSFWSVRGRTSTLTSFFNIRKLCNYNVRLVLWFVLHGMKIKQLFELKNFQMPTLQFLNNGCNFAVIITQAKMLIIFSSWHRNYIYFFITNKLACLTN